MIDRVRVKYFSLLLLSILLPATSSADRVAISPTNANRFIKPLSNSSIVCYSKTTRRQLVGTVKALRFNGSRTVSQMRRTTRLNINQVTRKLRGAKGVRRQSLLTTLATLRADLLALTQCQATPTTPPDTGADDLSICPDITRDGIVNRLDFDAFMRSFFRGRGDINHDGITNPTDYRLFLSRWRNGRGPANCHQSSSSSISPSSSSLSTSSSSSSSSVSSSSSAPTNLAPTVNAGVDQVILIGSNLTLNGQVADDGLPAGSSLSLTWSKVTGLGNVIFDNANNPTTNVGFSGPGSYTLRLTATDGELSASDDVQVVVNSTTHACSDGIDNDNDGLVDWQYDLGCSGPNDDYEIAGSREQKGGWTTYDKSSDTRVIYVSSSEGNDSWSGLCPTVPSSGDCGPKRTIYQGYLLLRPASADWLLLKRGDVWRNEYFTAYPQYGSVWSRDHMSGGRSDSERMVIASYGSSSSRPRLELRDLQGLWSVSNVAFHDLEIYGYQKDVNNPEFTGVTQTGIYMLYANRNITVENCRLRYASLIVQSVDDVNGQARFDNVQIRRNIVENAYSVGGHSQGIYSSTLHPGYLLLEENVFDHNGWNEEFRLVLYAPNRDLTQWRTITDGRFGVVINRQTLNLAGLNFSAASSMNDVAQVIQAAINTELQAPNAVNFRWSPLGHVFYLQADTFPSNAYYQIQAYAGSSAGTDLHAAAWLNSASQGAPEATVFNRNMYLSHGYGNTTVRGNIDANGASGGLQLRMGGIVTDNLYLRNPLSLTFGHPENPGNSTVAGEIRRNVILGSRDISDGPRGIGIALGSHATTSGGQGPSLIQNVVVTDNIVAHNELGTGNIVGLSVEGTGSVSNVDIHHNIVYNWARPVWPNPNDNRACALSLRVASGSSSFTVHQNSFQQPNRGFVACSAAATTLVGLVDNYYFSTSPDSGDLWSTGWFSFTSSISSAQWISQMGEINPHLQQVPYSDPNRSIERYMTSQNLTPSYDAFMVETKKQSRFDWRPAFTAQAVNSYIRQGFLP